MYADNVVHEDPRKVLEGTGRVVIVPDRYFKAGSASTTLTCSILATSAEKTSLPTWSNLVSDVNDVLGTHTSAAWNVVMNTPEDLGTSAYHLVSWLLGEIF